MEIEQRLEVFFARLHAAPPCRDAKESLALVCRLIDEVEDEFCPIPRREPPPKEPTGRMYSPKADSIRTMPDGSILANTRRHSITCRLDGSIVIAHKRELIVAFTKLGDIR